MYVLYLYVRNNYGEARGRHVTGRLKEDPEGLI